MKRKNFTLSIRTLYVMLILIFAVIILFQFYFLKNAQNKLAEELLSTHVNSTYVIEDKSLLKKLPQDKRLQLENKGATLFNGILYFKKGDNIVKVNLGETLIFRLGKNLIYLNIIFDLLLIWVALYFYFKIFADISRANTTIELSTNGKFIPEKLPDIEVEGVDKIIENFKTIYLDFLNTEKEIKRKSQFESLGLISARIIHDLKNTLAYILIMIYKAKTFETKQEVKDILTSIDLKIDELRLALEDVLYALRDGRDFKIEDVDIEILKNGFEKEFSFLAKNLGIDFKVNFDTNLVGKTIAVNPYHIKSAIENLIHNSIKILEKYNNKEKKMGLDFSLKGRNVEIVVWDNGEGISEQVKDNLFKSFVSGDDEGVGLGLSTVKEFVESNGGSIKLEMEDGLTKFILTVPFSGKKSGGVV